jgi:hypothetical protein
MNNPENQTARIKLLQDVLMTTRMLYDYAKRNNKLVVNNPTKKPAQ